MSEDSSKFQKGEVQYEYKCQMKKNLGCRYIFIVSQRRKLSVDHYGIYGVVRSLIDFFGNIFVVVSTQLLKTNLKIPSTGAVCCVCADYA